VENRAPQKRSWHDREIELLQHHIRENLRLLIRVTRRLQPMGKTEEIRLYDVRAHQ